MRKINEKEFANFSIVGGGWSFTVYKFSDALNQWKDVVSGTLYGNKPDGTRAIIDSK